MAAKNNKNKIRGNSFEEYAALWLINSGFSILERNYIGNRAETDIIAKKDNKVYFCEVKARDKDGQTNPLETITQSKYKRLVTSANTWLSQQKESDIDCIIALISIELEDTRGVKGERLEDIISCEMTLLG